MHCNCMCRSVNRCSWINDWIYIGCRAWWSIQAWSEEAMFNIDWILLGMRSGILACRVFWWWQMALNKKGRKRGGVICSKPEFTANSWYYKRRRFYLRLETASAIAPRATIAVVSKARGTHGRAALASSCARKSSIFACSSSMAPSFW